MLSSLLAKLSDSRYVEMLCECLHRLNRHTQSDCSECACKSCVSVWCLWMWLEHMIYLSFGCDFYTYTWMMCDDVLQSLQSQDLTRGKHFIHEFLTLTLNMKWFEFNSIHFIGVQGAKPPAKVLLVNERNLRGQSLRALCLEVWLLGFSA